MKTAKCILTVQLDCSVSSQVFPSIMLYLSHCRCQIIATLLRLVRMCRWLCSSVLFELILLSLTNAVSFFCLPLSGKPADIFVIARYLFDARFRENRQNFFQDSYSIRCSFACVHRSPVSFFTFLCSRVQGICQILASRSKIKFLCKHDLCYLKLSYSMVCIHVH